MLVQRPGSSRADNIRHAMIHPTDTVIEAYAGSRLDGREAQVLEEHLLLCARCRARLALEDETVELIRLAFTEFQVHWTDGGEVRIWVERQGDAWVGRLEGPAGAHACEEKAPGAAMAASIRAFRDTYPDHVCDGRCLRGGERGLQKP